MQECSESMQEGRRKKAQVSSSPGSWTLKLSHDPSRSTARPPTPAPVRPAGGIAKGDLLCAVDGRNTLLYRDWEDIRKELIGYPGSRVELYFLRQSTSRRGESQASRRRAAPPPPFPSPAAAAAAAA